MSNNTDLYLCRFFLHCKNVQSDLFVTRSKYFYGNDLYSNNIEMKMSLMLLLNLPTYILFAIHYNLDHYTVCHSVQFEYLLFAIQYNLDLYTIFVIQYSLDLYTVFVIQYSLDLYTVFVIQYSLDYFSIYHSVQSSLFIVYHSV